MTLNSQAQAMILKALAQIQTIRLSATVDSLDISESTWEKIAAPGTERFVVSDGDPVTEAILAAMQAGLESSRRYDPDLAAVAQFAVDHSGQQIAVTYLNA